MAGNRETQFNFGLVAHVDAGKTTLSEAILHLSGALNKKGRVDHRDTFLDTDFQERERGITIFSKMARFEWKNVPMTLLDTPGHTDFSCETERTFSVLDAAVLVISGTEGIQNHTRTLWNLLDIYQIPTFIFFNKMDRPDTNAESLLQSFIHEFGQGAVDMTSPHAQEDMAMLDDALLDIYLRTGQVPLHMIRRFVSMRKLFPVFFGSALMEKGVENLLDALQNDLPEPAYGRAFGARVFKIGRDAHDQRLTFLKVTGGSLSVRDPIQTLQDAPKEKITSIRLYSGARFAQTDEIKAGTICAVTGLENSFAGQGLGQENGETVSLMEPVLQYKVCLAEGTDRSAALKAFKILEEEDPLLNVVWQPQTQDILLRLMGDVQTEVLKRLLWERFKIETDFSDGGVLYKETIASPVTGVGHFEPLRHYAEVRLLLEPGERGSGIQIASLCSEDALSGRWQRLIMTHIAEKQHIGKLIGAPLTDVRISLLMGKYHEKHTEGGDFRQATYRAIRQGIMQAESVLLEPWYAMRLELPSDVVGKAMTDIEKAGGKCDAPRQERNCAVLTAKGPVRKFRNYAREVTVYTKGKGTLFCVPCGSMPVPDKDAAEIAASYAYDPERDMENPADSVFCSHGAGFVVSWKDAPDYMHIPPEKAAQNVAEKPLRSAVEASAPGKTLSSEEEEEELKRIFERTYGPIKPQQLRPVRKETAKEKETTWLPDTKEEFLLVDGYNLIFAWPELKNMAHSQLDAARDVLMEILCEYKAMRNCRLTVVFDAYKVSGGQEKTEVFKNIEAVFTKETESADAYIERKVRELSKNYRVRVATSDAMEQMLAMGGGALRVSAREFREEVENVHGEIQAWLDTFQRPSFSNTMAAAMRSAWKRKMNRDENP